MRSPLPDASALEAGILEDERPSRLSRVQDNVRNLLRSSRFASPVASPQASPTAAPIQHGLHTPPQTPTRRTQQPPEVLPSPSTESTTSTAESASPSPQVVEVPGILFPPVGYQRAVQQMAHQSALFNSRAVAALDHPDLTDPSLVVYAQQKAETRQQRAWKRSRHGRRRNVAAQAGSSQCLLCVLCALLLSAIVATCMLSLVRCRDAMMLTVNADLVLALTSTNITPTFHILFILGILLATIVFVHTVVRLFIGARNSRNTRRVLILPASRTKQRRHRRNHHTNPHNREMPTLSDGTTAFVPATAIRVHMPADEVRPDSREAQPTATADLGVAVVDWDKDVEELPNPPPAYGRWRGSVRANPDLLHWQPVPSPVDPHSPELPSPTYEEAVNVTPGRTGPPSYVTRDSPARRREVQEGEAVSETAGVQAQAATVEDAAPEMVEGRGIGLAQ